MKPERHYEKAIREALAAAGTASEPLTRRVLGAIAGRTPSQMSTLHAIESLPRISAVAGLLLAVLLGLTWRMTPPPAEVDLAENDPAPIVLQFEEEVDESNPSTVLTALVIEGMNP